MSDTKKALVLASVASMIDQFNMPNIKLLQEGGFKVSVIADFSHPGNITEERSKELVKELNLMGVETSDIEIPRSLNLSKIVRAYVKVKRIIDSEKFDLIHCHSPIGGVVARLAARKSRKKNGTKVIYTAHGFHFYDGAPLKNWMVFYPIEKRMSRYTDVLVTINQEDYNRALSKLKASETVYIPGIGIDTDRFKSKNGDAIRDELGIGKNEVMLLSVGELNDNKNHEVIIRALGSIPEKPFYVIVGKGDREEYYHRLIKEMNLQDRIKLVGYRADVADFYSAADVFVFPSFREGLSVSLMEAMASGLAVACSRIRGNVDLIDNNGGFFFDPGEQGTVVDALKKVLDADRQALGEHNKERIKEFDLRTVKRSISKIYGIDQEV